MPTTRRTTGTGAKPTAPLRGRAAGPTCVAVNRRIGAIAAGKRSPQQERTTDRGEVLGLSKQHHYAFHFARRELFHGGPCPIVSHSRVYGSRIASHRSSSSE